MADLAGAHLFVEYFEGFFQWREQVVRQMLVAQFAEEVGAALGPMQLVQVDAIGVQALQAVLQRSDDMLAVVLELAVADMADAVAGTCDFAREDPVVAIAMTAEPVADDALGGVIRGRPFTASERQPVYQTSASTRSSPPLLSP